jgi:hypothetical protein
VIALTDFVILAVLGALILVVGFVLWLSQRRK